MTIGTVTQRSFEYTAFNKLRGTDGAAAIEIIKSPSTTARRGELGVRLLGYRDGDLRLDMNSILDFVRDVVGRHEPEEEDEGRSIARAAAVLLIELALTDAGADEAERELIERAMRESFVLDEAEMRELLEQAGKHQRESHSLHDYTHALRMGLAPEARADLVEWLWRVAYADGRLDRHEELLVRRLADLLGVPHREFIRRKHRAGEATTLSAQ